jgi:hypothetical protein
MPLLKAQKEVAYVGTRGHTQRSVVTALYERKA